MKPTPIQIAKLTFEGLFLFTRIALSIAVTLLLAAIFIWFISESKPQYSDQIREYYRR